MEQALLDTALARIRDLEQELARERAITRALHLEIQQRCEEPCGECNNCLTFDDDTEDAPVGPDEDDGFDDDDEY